MSVEVGSVAIGGLTIVTFRLWTESCGRYYHSVHEELLTAHRVGKRLTVDVNTTKKQI